LEETFNLKISENNLNKYNFRKELPQRARSITSDDNDDGIRARAKHLRLGGGV
jgi:hypothetical protein